MAISNDIALVGSSETVQSGIANARYGGGLKAKHIDRKAIVFSK